MSRFQPALIGGLVIGVAASVPGLNIANCCCLFVIAGGVLTTYLLQQRTPEAIQTSEAMLQGLVAGLIGGVIFVAGTALLVDMATKMASIEQALERPDMPPEAREMVTKLMTGGGMFVFLAVVYIPCYAIFGLLGALLGTAFFKKKTPPAAPPVAPVQPGM